MNNTTMWHITFFCAISFGLFSSCSSKIGFTNKSTTRAFIKKDSLSNTYYSYVEQSGLSIPFLNVDTLYGNRKNVWITVSINNKKFIYDSIKIYLCNKTENMSTEVRLSKRIGVINESGKATIKLKYKDKTAFFVSEINETKALLYIIKGIEPTKPHTAGASL